MPVLTSSILDPTALAEAARARLITIRSHPQADLWILTYSQRAVYDGVWTNETRLCRGLITKGHPFKEDSVVVARPFAKFVSALEHGPDSAFGSLPQTSFEVTEKIDGSLVILYPGPDGPTLATKGSFDGVQAQAATRLWRENVRLDVPEAVTLLFEYLAPDNRIVIPYEETELVFLAAIDIATGADVDFPEWTGPRVARFDELASWDDLTRRLAIPADNAEGFVVRFMPTTLDEPSVRVKFKYPEYLRLHKLITGTSNLSVWEALVAGQPLDEMIEAVPDEFYEFVRTTSNELRAAHQKLVSGAYAFAEELHGLSRADAARLVKAQHLVPHNLVFAVLDHKDVDAMAWPLVRPVFEQPPFNG